MSALPNCHDNAILWERELKERQQQQKKAAFSKQRKSIKTSVHWSLLEISVTGSVSRQLAEACTVRIAFLNTQLKHDTTERNYALLMQPHSKSANL